jgi:hypothetical protein
LSARPNATFITWAREDSRARSISRELGGESRRFYDLRIQREQLVPIRYLLSAVRTLLYLVWRRPRAVIVQTPPVPAAAIVCAWAKLTGVSVIIDSHPASFALDGRRVDRLVRPLLARLAPVAAGCIVTMPELGKEIERWGGRSLVVHEAPPAWREHLLVRGCSSERRLLFVCTFAPDEPLMEALAAAHLLPDVRLRVTGDTRRLSPEARRAAPGNVEWVGYLGPDDYVQALAGADVVMSLTTRDESVARSAYDAVYALRPLVISGGSHMKELFPYSVTVRNEAASIAEGINEAFSRCDELSANAADARDLQERRWHAQLASLQAALEAGNPRTGERSGDGC